MIAALYGVPAPRDRYFCPSSPAWGMGSGMGRLPHGRSMHIAGYAGKSRPRIFEALAEFQITNIRSTNSVPSAQNPGCTTAIASHLEKFLIR
jgi:acetyl-CoA synthetase